MPGVGKTLLARAFARALGLSFGRIQGTPDLLPGDVTGASVLDGTPAAGMSLRFVPGPVFTNVLLVDEINRATPRTQSALLEAMQERQVSVEGVTRTLPDPFLVLATQNPIEYEGTFALPEAQLDRFLLRLRIGYPGPADERRIAGRYAAAAEPLDGVPMALPADRIAGLREGTRIVHVADELVDYLVAIVGATRDRPDVELGASPRASVALYPRRPGRRHTLPAATSSCRTTSGRSSRPCSATGCGSTSTAPSTERPRSGSWPTSWAGSPSRSSDPASGPDELPDRPVAERRRGRAARGGSGPRGRPEPGGGRREPPSSTSGRSSGSSSSWPAACSAARSW